MEIPNVFQGNGVGSDIPINISKKIIRLIAKKNVKVI